jgi:hypothetical protein
VEYQAARQPVIFIEQNVDTPVDYSRMLRFYYSCQAWGGGDNCSLLPFTMTDSGFNTMNGYSYSFMNDTRVMVDASLVRTPGAEISATVQRVGDHYHFDIQVTNQSGMTLSSANEARVYALVYETKPPDGTTHLTSRVVRAAASTGIASLAHLASGAFALDTDDLSGVVWENLHPVVIVDYRTASGYYDALQTAFEYYPLSVHLPLVMKD